MSMSATPKGTSSNTVFIFPNQPTTPQTASSEAATRKVFFPQLPDPKKLKDKQKVKPLSKDFFIELIKLETDFQRKNFTVETIDELTQYYARAVEYYDSIKDNIASYFLFKIQDTLATKQSLKLLIEQNKQQKRGSVMSEETSDPLAKHYDKLKKSIIEEHTDESDEDKPKNKPPPKKKESVIRMSYSQLKNEKAKFVNQYVNIDNKIEEEAHIDKMNVNIILDTYADKSNHNDQIIENEIDAQKSNIKKRLLEKKAKKQRSNELDTFINDVMTTSNNNLLDGIEDKNFSDSKSSRTGYSNEYDTSPYTYGDSLRSISKSETNMTNEKTNGTKSETNIRDSQEKTQTEEFQPEIKEFNLANGKSETSQEETTTENFEGNQQE